MDTEPDDPAMARARAWVGSQDALTLAELGERMGFPAATARQAAHQFLKAKDPRIGTLRRFAKASGIPMSELTAESAAAGPAPETKKDGKKKRT